MADTTIMKPGYKTTEFWLIVAVMTLCTLVSSGILGSGGMVETVVGIAGQILSGLGYGQFRATVKKEFEKRLGQGSEE